MKRSKQRFDRPDNAIPQNVSGCRQFEGEDLLYNQRMLRNAELQKEWATQQLREKKAAKDAEKEEEKDYAQQNEAILRMRGMLEDETSQRKANHARMIADENKRMAREKRAREQAARDADEQANQAETKSTVHPEELQMDGTIKRNMFSD